MSKDSLHRFIFEGQPVRGEFVRLEESIKTILGQHNYPDAVRKLLSEALCAAVLLSAIIKFEGRLTVQFRGEGKLKLLLAQCDNEFHLRGLAKYDEDCSYDELLNAFNDGVLVITLDALNKGQRYQGVVAWEGNSLAESIEGYFANSEQLATKIWLSSNKDIATGYLLQVIPTEKELMDIHKEFDIPVLEKMIEQTNLAGENIFIEKEYPDFLKAVYPEETIRVFDPLPISFECKCNRDRCKNAIQILGREEAEKELAEKNSLVVTCDFCNKEYIFDRVDVAQVFEEQQPPDDSQLH